MASPRFLNTKNDYVVLRIGKSLDRVTTGKMYVARWTKTYSAPGHTNNYNWVIKDTDDPDLKLQPTLSPHSDVWLVLHSVGYEHIVNEAPKTNKPEGKVMPTQFHNATIGRMINTECASEFSDKEVIGFIKNQRCTKQELADDVGEESKYYKSKVETIDAQLKILAAELESRA